MIAERTQRGSGRLNALAIAAPMPTGQPSRETLAPPQAGDASRLQTPASPPDSDECHHQRRAALPQQVIAASLEHPVLRGLLPIHAGFIRSTAGSDERRAGVAPATFIYCTKGRGRCELEGCRHEVGPGDLLVLPPRVPHAYGADGNPPWTFWWVQALGTNLDFFLAELGTSPRNPVLALGENAQLPALFHEVLETLEGGCSAARLLYASQALAHLIGAMIWRRGGTGRSEPDTWQKIEQSISYMQQHLDKPLPVATLAVLANMSPSHYTALFKRRTGCAPIDYFIRLRMRQACHMLAATSLNVKDVAAVLGYEDPFYFSRLFKSVNQIAPSDYRRRLNPGAKGGESSMQIMVSSIA
jgi:AraC-like DNA-binding protein